MYEFILLLLKQYFVNETIIAKIYDDGNTAIKEVGCFDSSGDYKSAVDGNLETFKYNILKSLVSTLSVSAIRISNLNVRVHLHALFAFFFT